MIRKIEVDLVLTYLYLNNMKITLRRK